MHSRTHSPNRVTIDQPTLGLAEATRIVIWLSATGDDHGWLRQLPLRTPPCIGFGLVWAGNLNPLPRSLTSSDPTPNSPPLPNEPFPPTTPGVSCPASLYTARLPADLAGLLAVEAAELAPQPQQLHRLFQSELS